MSHNPSPESLGACLDHLMYACADLQTGIDEIYELTGVMPALGGSHPGVGTRNALLSLGNNQYLEIIAPDPEQNLQNTFGQLLLDHGGSGIRSWAIACPNLQRVADIAAAQQLASRDIIDMSRTTPDGIEMAWQLLFLHDPHLPFFIDWQDSPHPSLSTPTGCGLEWFNISAVQAQAYETLLSGLGLPMTVTTGTNAFSAGLQTPKGAVTLHAW